MEALTTNPMKEFLEFDKKIFLYYQFKCLKVYLLTFFKILLKIFIKNINFVKFFQNNLKKFLNS
jgi:hypothetical protein